MDRKNMTDISPRIDRTALHKLLAKRGEVDIETIKITQAEAARLLKISRTRVGQIKERLKFDGLHTDLRNVLYYQNNDVKVGRPRKLKGENNGC